MVTSIDIDEALFLKPWGLSGLRTKKAFFEEAMRVYVRLHEQAGVRALRGQLSWPEEPEARGAKRGARGADPR